MINEKKNNKRQENESVCYLRAKWMYEPLPLPPKINKKINYVLQELNIPPKIMSTEENEQLYDELRENILKMFSLQKFLKKKELQRQNLESRNEIKQNYIVPFQ